MQARRMAKEEEHPRLTHNPALGRDLQVVLIAKGLNEPGVSAKRRERLIQCARGEPELIRSLFDGGRTIDPAPYLRGAVLCVGLDRDDLLDLRDVQGVHAIEPFESARHGSRSAVALADHILLIDEALPSPRVVKHPWFAQLHSVCFSPDGSKLLITSGDLDSILELDIATDEIPWHWTSWENGHQVGADGTRLARNEAELANLSKQGKAILIGTLDNVRYARGIATATQPFHVNSAIYSRRDTILATVFHSGEVVEIDRTTLSSRTRLKGLKEPHAIEQTPEGYCVTDTRNGLWIHLDEELNVVRKVRICDLPGKDPAFGQLEWIQTVSHLAGDLHAAVDSIRAQIHIIDRRTFEYRSVSFNRNLILQSVHVLGGPRSVAQLLSPWAPRVQPSDFEKRPSSSP
jgi:hypothetical protein